MHEQHNRGHTVTVRTVLSLDHTAQTQQERIHTVDPVPTFLSFTSLSILSTCTAETRPWPLASQLTSISISRRHRAARASGAACWPPGAKGPAERISQAACSETLALPAESLPLGCAELDCAELDCAELNFCTSSPRFLSIACCSWPCTLQQCVTDNARATPSIWTQAASPKWSAYEHQLA